jgi:hypothetical protein
MSARLTKYERDAFISAVLEDVPHTDYQELARVALQKKAIELLPAKLKPLHKEFGHWFKTDRLWNMPNPLSTVTVVSFDDAVTLKLMKEDTAFWAPIEKMATDAKAQTAARDAIRQKVHACIYACNTVKRTNVCRNSRNT